MEKLVGKYLQLRLFAEGVELPVIGATVQMSINFPAVASIQIVPIDASIDLKKGTMVHLFFYDFLQDGAVKEDFERYRLLFAGETTGVIYTKSSLGRSAVLQCADFSNAWQRCYQYMITYGPNGNFITPEASNYAASSSKLNNIIDGHLAVLSRYLNSSPKSLGLRNIKGLLGGILRIVEEFGGVIGHTRGVNDWFTYQELKNKIMQQIAAEEDDKTAQNLFSEKEFYEWLENGLVSLGELCTLWDMLRLLFQYIYYETSPNTCAYYVKGTDPDQFLDTEKINNTLRDVSASLYDNEDLRDIKLRALNASKNLKLLNEYQYLADDQEKNLLLARNVLQLILDDSSYSKKITERLTSAKKYVDASIVNLDKKQISNIKVERLNSIIFKPECYFVSPPRCSVVFPEHNTQFTYSQNFTQEYTRLRLQSGMLFNIDSEKLFADYSYAPSGPEIRKYAKKEGFGTGLNSVLPWEKYTGILPKFEYIQEINYVSSKKGKEEQKNVQGIAKSYKQRAANFNFYKYRFMSRQISGSCRFNPMLVVGFPLVVIDQPFIVDREKLIDIAKQRGTELEKVTSQDIINNIKEFSKELGAPKQFIGYATTLSHMIDQTGATTNFSCSHARPHKITDDDFLLIFENTAKEEKMTTVTKRTVLDLETILKNKDFESLQYLINLTPQIKPRSNIDVGDASFVDDLFIGAPSLTPKETKPKLKLDGFDVFTPSLRFSPKEGVSDYVGETQDAIIDGGTVKIPKNYGELQIGNRGRLGIISAIRVVNDFIKVVPFKGKDYYAWRTIVVYEEKEEPLFKPIPIEHILRPSWYSYLYSNLNIGQKIYGKFFGCGAVVDELVFSSPEGLSIQGAGSSSNEILDNLSESTELISDVNQLSQTNLVNAPSVETAIDVLAFQYGEALTQGLDVNKFVNDYTYRPIATMKDVLGSEDLELRLIGNDLRVSQGELGFHSIAVSGYDKLRGLLSSPDLPIPGRTISKTLPAAIDTRKEKKEAVEEYLQKLNVNSGSVIGVKG